MVGFSLQGKIALVTGASRGIGASIARLLAANGARVLLAARKLEALKEVEGEIAAAGGEATSYVCHVGDLPQMDTFFQQLQEDDCVPDILVNNAATNPFFGSVLKADEAAWDKTADVNLKGYFFMSQKAARLMKEKGGGAIVNVASVNGLVPAPMQGIYSITKAGVISMTRVFAKELAPFNIRVNALIPGLTETKFASALIDNEQIFQSILGQIPMNRQAQPDEMAGAVLYLVSEAASYTTGSCLVVDGGLLA